MSTEEAGISLIFQVKGQRRTDYFSVRLFCMQEKAHRRKERMDLDKKTPL